MEEWKKEREREREREREMAQQRTLYVGGLEESVNEAQLHAAFIAFGEIKDVTIPLENAVRSGGGRGEQEERQRHRGFGFVEYEERGDAEAAMENMNDAELFGRTLRVNFAGPMKAGSKAIWDADADAYFGGKDADDAGKEDTGAEHNEEGGEKRADRDPAAAVS